MTTSETWCQRLEMDVGRIAQSPVLGSTSASLRILTMLAFCSLVVGFILKFPPTKNWRLILALSKSFGRVVEVWDWKMIRLR